jgi:hypothetical protein
MPLIIRVNRLLGTYLGEKFYVAPNVAEGHEPVRRAVPLPRA